MTTGYSCASVMFMLFVSMITSNSLASVEPDPRPNIIFILTDDQRWDAMGHAGNNIIHTPNMDRLASEGVYFSNAFVTTPICAASRASIITGLYERTHGFTFQTPPLKKKFVELSYFNQMKKHGYYTGFIGKFGMSFEDHFDTLLFDYYDPYMADFYYRLRGPGWSEHIHVTDLTGEKAIEFIRESPRDKPFCLSISFNAPHAEDRSPEQYIYPAELEELYKDINLPPPALADNQYFNDQPDYVRKGLNRIRWHWRFDTPQKYQEKVKAYYRMITAVDKVLGEIRETLDEEDLEKNTVIIFTSDNGYFLGERGLAGKWLMYENSIRIPLIIFDPRITSHNQARSQMVLNIDIAPTLLEMADIPVPNEMQGLSLFPLIIDEGHDLRDHFLCEHLYEIPFIPKSEGIRTTEWKYFRYIDDPDHEELYNLIEDPLEINNLVEKEAQSSRLVELRAKCDNTIELLIEAR